jgi:hypothetical protein
MFGQNRNNTGQHNKRIIVRILVAEKAVLKSSYATRYMSIKDHFQCQP